MTTSTKRYLRTLTFAFFMVLLAVAPVTAATPVAQDDEPLTPPEGEALLVVSNESLANVPSTLTLAGGEFGGGEEFTIDASEIREIPVEPADDYRLVWTSPPAGEEDEEAEYNQEFVAVPGRVFEGTIVPEQQTVTFKRLPAMTMMAESEESEMTETEESEMAAEDEQMMQEQAAAEMDASEQAQQDQQYSIPAGQGLIVVRNNSIANVPSTLTLAGGEFAGGEEFTIDADETRQIAVEPADDYRLVWTSPPAGVDDEEAEFNQDFTVVAGRVFYGSIVPEEQSVNFRRLPSSSTMQSADDTTESTQ